MSDLFGPMPEVIKLALDATTLRHQVIANNIANVNSPGYSPLKVNFEEQLSSLENTDTSNNEALRQLRQAKPFIEAENIGAQNSPKVMLDMEMVKLNQNVIHYQSLLKALNKEFSILGIAINEGKRS